jgi:signal transduction histidine kinase
MSELTAHGDTVPRGSRLPWICAPSPQGWLVRLVALVVTYYLAAQAGYKLDIAGPVAAIVWLPVGVGIAFLTLGGVNLWPGVLIGDLLVNDYSVLPLGTAVAQSIGNVLEVVVAAVIIRRVAVRRDPLGSLGALGVMLLGIVAGTAVSATIGVTAQVAGDVIMLSHWPSVWRTWWLGDMAGAIVVVPLVLAWVHRPSGDAWHGRAVEAVVVLAAVTVVGELIFRSDTPLTYLAFPGLMWAALRLGARGATLAVALTVWTAAWNTAHYVGPFVFLSPGHAVTAVQLFVIAAAATTLAMVAAIAERRRFAHGLAASRARIVDAADAERRRIERNLHDGAQQRLTALAMELHAAGDIVQTDPDGSARILDGAQQQLALAVEELRDLAHGIHPAVLTRGGLAQAVESLVARSSETVRLGPFPPGRLDDAVEATGYYVIAEALANAQKHARAGTIWVRGTLDGGWLRLEVADDGVGGATDDAGSGLQGMRDRVDAIGGVLRIDSPPGHGTRVHARLPARVASASR